MPRRRNLRKTTTTSAIATRIAIIGASFSGSLLAVQLFRRFALKARIYLIEKNAAFGRRVAYSTGTPGPSSLDSRLRAPGSLPDLRFAASR